MAVQNEQSKRTGVQDEILPAVEGQENFVQMFVAEKLHLPLLYVLGEGAFFTEWERPDPLEQGMISIVLSNPKLLEKMSDALRQAIALREEYPDDMTLRAAQNEVVDWHKEMQMQYAVVVTGEVPDWLAWVAWETVTTAGDQMTVAYVSPKSGNA